MVKTRQSLLGVLSFAALSMAAQAADTAPTGLGSLNPFDVQRTSHQTGADNLLLCAGDCTDPGLSLGCDAGGCGSLFSSCGDEEPFTLAGALGLDEDSRWKIGGWTQIGYYDNNVPLSQAPDDLLSFQDNADTLQINQQWFYVERTAAPEEGWGIGGRVDVVYGVDAQKTQSFGNPNAGIRNQGSFDASWDNGIYGWAMPQLYAEVANSEWSIKVGHFFTPLGYEVIPATGNFFYSHSYTMFNSEPFTHTGVLATYTGFENVTAYGGWTLGWDTGFDQLNSGSSWLGGLTVNVSEDVAVTYLSTAGNFGWRDGGGSSSYSHSIVMTAGLTDNLQYVFQSDLLQTSNGAISQFDTVGINQYLFYTINDMLKVGGRYEWWKADGISFNAVSVGMNVFAMKNLVIRPEYRQDWAPGIGLDEDTLSIDAVLSY